MAETPEFSCLIVCPYLPLRDRIDFAGWSIGPVEAFAREWADPRLEEPARSFLRAFLDAHGHPLTNPAIIARGGTGPGGPLPSRIEREALQLALDFAVLDSNPNWDADAPRASWPVVTGDNSQVFFWAIQTGDDPATDPGVVVRAVGGGYRVPAPLGIHLPNAVSVNPQLLDACYRIFTGERDRKGAKRARRIKTSVRWLAKVWRGAADVTPEDRLVLLYTAFEAFTGERAISAAAARLRATFEWFKTARVEPSEIEHLLWSPAEEEIHLHTSRDPVTGGKREEYLTDLEDWFMAFAAARNAIVHEAILPDLTYSQPGTAYRGPLLFVGTRLLREAITVEMRNLGFPYLWRARWQQAGIAFRQLSFADESIRRAVPDIPPDDRPAAIHHASPIRC